MSTYKRNKLDSFVLHTYFNACTSDMFKYKLQTRFVNTAMSVCHAIHVFVKNSLQTDMAMSVCCTIQ